MMNDQKQKRAQFKIEINHSTKEIDYWKRANKREYLKSLGISSKLKKDINLLISKCKNIP